MHRGLLYLNYNETEYMVLGSGYYHEFNSSEDVFSGISIYNV